MADLNYHHLRYFWAVANDGNLTRTAARLNVAASALSLQIGKLEDRLGHKLFERRGRRLELTEAGRMTLDHADAIFATGAELVGTLRRTGFARRALRIGALATLSRNFQMSFLAPVIGRSDIEIVLRSGSPSELFAALQDQRLDVVLTNQVPQPDALTPIVAHRLFDQPVSLVGKATLIDRQLPNSTLLAERPIILPLSSGGVRMGIDALVARLGIRLQIAAEVDDMAMMRLLVRQGVGIALLPAIVVQDELASGALVDAGEVRGIIETFFAATVERRFPNPIVHTLIDAATGGRAA